MLNDASDSLYDIQPIPAFPFNIGLELWLGLLVFLIVALLFFLLQRFYQNRSKIKLDSFKTLLEAIDQALQKPDFTQAQLSSLQSITKRFLKLRYKLPFESLSPYELKEAALSKPPELSQILQFLAGLDQRRYAAAHTTLQTSELQSLKEKVILLEKLYQEQSQKR